MFRMRRCSPTFLKLTTICDVSHVISFTRPSSPLFFPTREEGLGTRLGFCKLVSCKMQMQSSLVSYSNNRVYRWVWNNANLIYLISGFSILHLQTDNQLAKHCTVVIPVEVEGSPWIECHKCFPPPPPPPPITTTIPPQSINLSSSMAWCKYLSNAIAS